MGHSPEYYVFQWVSIIFLISLSGLFAGLTLGIMSLDITGLEIVIASGTPKESKYARKIYPVRQRGNLLLCTLLLGNVAVNALLSILMADMTSGFVGFILSTTIIVLAGEIIPQAACSRHALAVGAHTIWIVYIFIFLFFPFSFPISKALDFILGSEMGTIYSRQQLKKLLDIHSIHQESGVSRSDVTLLTGVLDFSQKKVAQVMTPLDRVFMLDIDTRLDFSVMTSILENGHSRMPVYEGSRTNIVGCLYMRDLVLLNPEDRVPLKTIISLYHRQLLKTWHDTSLDQMLTEFKTGKSHMAIVHRVNNEGEGDPFYENLGIICLEDVLEEILQDEILDESDHYHSTDVKDRGALDYRTISSFHTPKANSKLSPQQIIAIYSFLSSSLQEFSSKMISEGAFSKMLASKGAVVLEQDKPKHGDKFIYTRGQVDEYFTIILQGKLEIRSGSEGFISEGGPFSTLGVSALKNDTFIPDFTARIISPSVQLLRISKSGYDHAVKMTTDEYNSHVFQRRNNNISDSPNMSVTTYTMSHKAPPSSSNISDLDSTSSLLSSSPSTTTTTTTTTGGASLSPFSTSTNSKSNTSGRLGINNNNNNNNNNNINRQTNIPTTTTTTTTTSTADTITDDTSSQNDHSDNEFLLSNNSSQL